MLGLVQFLERRLVRAEFAADGVQGLGVHAVNALAGEIIEEVVAAFVDRFDSKHEESENANCGSASEGECFWGLHFQFLCLKRINKQAHNFENVRLLIQPKENP